MWIFLIGSSVVIEWSSMCHHVIFLSQYGHRSALGGGLYLYFICHLSRVITYWFHLICSEMSNWVGPYFCSMRAYSKSSFSIYFSLCSHVISIACLRYICYVFTFKDSFCAIIELIIFLMNLTLFIRFASWELSNVAEIWYNSSLRFLKTIFLSNFILRHDS